MLTYQSFASGKISVADSSGNMLAEYTPSKNYSCVVVSCPGLTKGGIYTVTACGQSQSVTLDGIIYGNGSMGGGQGGQPGQGGQQPGGTPSDGDPGQQNDGSGNSGSRPTPPAGDPRWDNSAQSGQKSSFQSTNQDTKTA